MMYEFSICEIEIIVNCYFPILLIKKLKIKIKNMNNISSTFVLVLQKICFRAKYKNIKVANSIISISINLLIKILSVNSIYRVLQTF